MIELNINFYILCSTNTSINLLGFPHASIQCQSACYHRNDTLTHNLYVIEN